MASSSHAVTRGDSLRHHILQTLDAAEPLGANARLILSVVQTSAPGLSLADVLRELYALERLGWVGYDPEAMNARITTAGRAALASPPKENVIHLSRLFPGRFQGPPAHAARWARIEQLIDEATRGSRS